MSDITESVSLFNQSVGNLGASIHNYGAEKLGLSEEEKKKQYNRLIAEQVKESPLGGTSVGKVASLGIEGGQMTPAQIASFLGQSAEESIGWLARESIGNEGARSLLNETLAKYNFVKYNQAKYQEAGALDAKIERGFPAGEKPKEYKYSVSGNGLVTSLKNLKSIKVPLKTPEGKEIGSIDIDTKSDEPLSNQIASKISSGVGGFLGFGKTKFDPQQQNAIYKLASDAVRGQISNYLQSVAGDVYLSNPTKLAFHTERILGQWMAGGFKQWQKDLSDQTKGYTDPVEDTVYDSVSSPQSSNKIIRAGGPDAGVYDLNAPAKQSTPSGAATPEEFTRMLDEVKQNPQYDAQDLKAITEKANPNNIYDLYEKNKKILESSAAPTSESKPSEPAKYNELTPAEKAKKAIEDNKASGNSQSEAISQINKRRELGFKNAAENEAISKKKAAEKELLDKEVFLNTKAKSVLSAKFMDDSEKEKKLTDIYAQLDELKKRKSVFSKK